MSGRLELHNSGERERVIRLLEASRDVRDRKLGASIRDSDNRKGLVDIAASLLDHTGLIAAASDDERTLHAAGKGLEIIGGIH